LEVGEDTSTEDWLKLQFQRKARTGSPAHKAHYAWLMRQFFWSLDEKDGGQRKSGA